jgi:septum formation protein
MDLPIFKKLGQGRIILASKSPRRKQILEQQLGFRNISVLPSSFAEDFDKNLYSPFEVGETY